MNAIDVVNAQSEIRAARERWAAKQAEMVEEKRQQAEETRREMLGVLSRGHTDWWALEYAGEITPSVHEWCVLIEMRLPGCAPFRIEMDRSSGAIYDCRVQEPTHVNYRDGQGWIVEFAEQWIDDADQTIDLAASFGESWFEMQSEADRRNAEGLKPAAPAPTAWESAQEALGNARLALGNPLFTDKEAVAVALVAIVEQINLLNDNLMRMDR